MKEVKINENTFNKISSIIAEQNRLESIKSDLIFTYLDALGVEVEGKKVTLNLDEKNFTIE